MYLSEEMAFRSKPMVEMAANRRLDAAWGEDWMPSQWAAK
jgi:hypothetical protein